MRHQKRTFTLDRKRGARKALVRSLAMSLIRTGSITTTPAKARALQQFIEPLVRRAKNPTTANRRLIIARLGGQKAAAARLCSVIGPKFSARAGGMTRRVHVAPRKGDGASQVKLEWTT